MRILHNQMRITTILVLAIIIPLFGLSCDDGGGSVAASRWVADFTMEAPDYLAKAPGAFGEMKSLFFPVVACALPDLSIPTDEFTGAFPIPDDTEVYLLAADGATIATGLTDGLGHVIIDEVPDGYIRVLVIGGGGKTWSAQTHIDPDHDTYMRAVLKDNPDGQKSIYSKSIHNDAGVNTNIDDFSIATYARPHSTPNGGYVILHENGKTLIDVNGDGDFIDPEDRNFFEADDDGLSSAEGDGDEDNDGIIDKDEQGDDDDLDGDGISNDSDTDDDGDGILDGQDDTPLGITSLDDFNPPTLIDPNGTWDGDPYTGITDVQIVWLDPEQTEADPGKVRVFFPGAEDRLNNDISYRIYYDDEEVEFDESPWKEFNPVTVITDPAELYDYLLTGLDTGETWYFAVRALDSAPPPNEDENEEMLSLELPDD